MPGDGRDRFASGAPGLGDGEHVIIDGGGASAAPPLSLGSPQPVEGPLADEVAFHLGGHGGDHEQHLVGDGGAVGAVQARADAGQDVQVDPACMQLVFEQHEEFLHGTRHPVRLVDHQGVAGLEHVHRGKQFRALATGAGGLDDDLAAVRCGERVELRLVILGAGGDAGVADADAVVVDGGGSHGAIIPEPIPEPVERHAVPGLVSGTTSRGFRGVAGAVPETADSGTAPETVRVSPRPGGAHAGT